MIRKVYRGFMSAAVLVLGLALPALAADAPPESGTGLIKFALSLAAGFGLAIAAFGGALGQARAVAAAMEGIARNPGARAQMFIPLILGLVFIESLVLYMFVISFFLIGKIGTV